MTKTEFLEQLERELTHKNVSDTPEILEEYRQHFAFKLADGYSEEEIAAKLGAPAAIAAQYDAAPAEGGRGKKAVTLIGLGAADFFFALLCVLLCAWEAVMAALTAACAAITVGLLANIRVSVFACIPAMPYPCALLFGIVFAALVFLSAIGFVYFGGFVRQLMRSFGRFHQNALASASGRAVLPSLALYPQFPPKMKRQLRALSLIAVSVFAVCFVLGFIISAISAGAFEFWHSWGWFGYAG